MSTYNVRQSGRRPNEITTQFIQFLQEFIEQGTEEAHFPCPSDATRRALRCSSTFRTWQDKNNKPVSLYTRDNGEGFVVVRRELES